MRILLLRSIFAAVILLSLQSFKPGDFKLLLKSGTFVLPEGEIETSLNGVGENGFYYRIMQFYAIPTLTQKEQLKDLGISFFGYLPKNSFLVAIPVGLDAKRLTQYNVRSIARVSTEMKLSKALSEGNIPAWCKRPGDLNSLVAAFYPNVSSTSVNTVLKSLNIEYENYPMDNFVRVFVTSNQLDQLSECGLVYYIQEDDGPSEPENFKARTSHRINSIQGNYLGATNYDGTDVVVATGDDGDVGNHIDYQGRITSHAGSSLGDHGDHVIGTVFGAGNRDPRGRGMAPGATMEYFNYSSGQIYLWEADTMYDQLGVRITQSSYSNYPSNVYSAIAQEMDKQVREKRSLMHVFSAGNAGSGWSTITGGHKQAKNVIATGNVLFDDNLAGSSSRGPAHDGRIKPDICAVGTSVYSTTDLTSSGYTIKTGTSMASPGASGTLATLYHAYKENNNQTEPDGGLMKAVLMNSADDIGNLGPDFKHGYGRLNARRAIEAIENNWIIIDSVTQGQADTIPITVGAGIAELRVMVYWSDPQATVNASRALVNNLDFTLYNAVGTSNWKPWVLNPNSVNQTAVRATDSLNNAEQVTLNNPSTGDYKVVVAGTSVPTGPQRYYIVYSLVPDAVKLTHPMGGDHFVPGQQEYIRWDAPNGTGSFTLQYSTDSGATYTTISNNVASSARYYTWTVPNTVTGRAMVRVSRGTQSSTSEAPFSIIGVPSNINVVWACPDSLLLAWNSVTGATGYQIHQLGAKYMDSIGTSTSTSFVVPNINPNNTYWFSVRALGTNNCVGRRAVAIEKTPGTFGCQLSADAALQEVSPTELPSCQGLSSIPVNITLKNMGMQNMFNIPVAYQINNGTIVRDTILDTINSGGVLNFTFGTTFSVTGSGTYPSLVYAELSTDQNQYNDTLFFDLSVFQSNSKALPYLESFDSFNNCSTQSNCEATVCGLANDWKNLANITEDDIDFRTNSGTTPSSNTGPSSDHTGNGKYLYLEASGGCTAKEAVLITPCFDLTGTTAPQASFWYHMFGIDMGDLHIDVLVDGVWQNDVINPISGNQGSTWQQLTFSLNSFIGKTINFRFRGITGSDYRSDICIDDFEIKDASGPPSVDFTATSTSTCVNIPITLQDQTLQGPTQWKWTITPSTYQFVGGTNDTTQNPEVSFTSLGLYTVKLKAINQYGSDSLTKVSFIDINNGNSLPLQENFNGVFPPLDWSIINPDGQITWQKSGQVTGSDGNATYATFMNNFNYNNANQEDLMVLPKLDVAAGTNAYLTFDVAYAEYSALYSDGLRIEISTDCGLTFTDTIYNKQGQVLATVPNLTSQFTPGSANHWRKDSIDLSSYNGNTIALRFVAINGYGNSLYVDNINILASGVQAPIASFTSSSANPCVGDAVIFTSTSTGAINTYDWNFGSGATPATANTAGPHSVVYSTKGVKTVTLDITNTGGSNTASNIVTVLKEPEAAFSAVNSDTLSINLTDLSSENPTQWLWNFGDGSPLVTVQNPIHTYANGGSYNVTLTATNGCGSSDSTIAVYVSGIGINEEGLENQISLVPNPASSQVQLVASFNGTKNLQVDILDITGKQLNSYNWHNAQNGNNMSINVETLSSGVYIIRIGNNAESITKRLIIDK